MKMSFFDIFLNNDKSSTYVAISPKGRRMTFQFKYSYVALSWRAYIISSPSYGNRPTDLHYTHRHYDNSKNLYYVCWTVKLSRLSEIEEVSRVWARETAKYIETGERF
jgi:hypothetical protein